MKALDATQVRVHAIMAPWARPWRWFRDGSWIVVQPPCDLIAAETIHHVHRHADVHSVEVVFRATPSPGIYLRFQLREVARKEP